MARKKSKPSKIVNRFTIEVREDGTGIVETYSAGDKPFRRRRTKQEFIACDISEKRDISPIRDVDGSVMMLIPSANSELTLRVISQSFPTPIRKSRRNPINKPSRGSLVQDR